MALEVRHVTTEDQREALRRFRAQVLVDETDLDGYRLRSRQALYERYAEASTSYALYDDTAVVGCLTCTDVSRLADPTELVLKYQLEPALEAFGAEAIVVTDGLMIAAQQRGEQAILPLLWCGFEEARGRGARLAYGDCSPHLLPFFEQIGYRRYSGAYNDSLFGFKIPILMLLGDRRYLTEARSPLESLVPEDSDDSEARRWLQTHYPDAETPLTAGFLGDEAFWNILSEHVARDPVHHAALWQDLSAEQIQTLLKAATIVPIRTGDFLIRKGDRENTVYVLLNGIAEVISDPSYTRPLSILGAGDTIGEIGFLRDVPRTADVVARTEGEVLVLSGEFLEGLLQSEPEIAAKLMLNLARELAARLTLTSERLHEVHRRR